MDYDTINGIPITRPIRSPLDLLGDTPDMPKNWSTTSVDRRLPMTAYRVITVKSLNRLFGW